LFWDDTNHLLGIGTNAPINAITIVGTAASAASRSIGIYAYGTGEAPDYRGFGANGTVSVPLALNQNDYLMAFSGGGYDGSAFQHSASIVGMHADQNWGAGARGSNITFETTPNGGTSRAVRQKVDNAGNFIFNMTGALLAQNATANFPYIPGVATGAPSGVPALPYTGAYPMVYDPTNTKLWLYDSGAGAWKGVALA
jgi:hypothetical protein